MPVRIVRINCARRRLPRLSLLIAHLVLTSPSFQHFVAVVLDDPSYDGKFALSQANEDNLPFDFQPSYSK